MEYYWHSLGPWHRPGCTREDQRALSQKCCENRQKAVSPFNVRDSEIHGFMDDSLHDSQCFKQGFYIKRTLLPQIPWPPQHTSNGILPLRMVKIDGWVLFYYIWYFILGKYEIILYHNLTTINVNCECEYKLLSIFDLQWPLYTFIED